MKTYLILFFLITGCPVFSQSAKKLNEQLRAEIVLEQRKQDSCHRDFNHSFQRLDSVKKQVYFRLDKMNVASTSIRESFYLISAAKSILNKLGRNPEVDLEQFMAFTDYGDFISSITQALKTSKYFDQVFYPDDVDTYKRKEQNLFFEKQLLVYRKVSQMNAQRFLVNEFAREELEAFFPSLDSMLTQYQLASKELLSKRDELEKEVEPLRENYRLNGPQGFSEAYRDAFPYVHLLRRENGKNVVYEESKRANSGDIQPKKPEAMIVRKQEPEIFDITDEPASFPGGLEAMKKYLVESIKYPQTAKDSGISGKVFLKFIVSDKGIISNVKILRRVPGCRECDDEALRVIKAMPLWIPAKINGKAVNSYFNIPIQFKM